MSKKSQTIECRKCKSLFDQSQSSSISATHLAYCNKCSKQTSAASSLSSAPKELHVQADAQKPQSPPFGTLTESCQPVESDEEEEQEQIESSVSDSPMRRAATKVAKVKEGGKPTWNLTKEVPRVDMSEPDEASDEEERPKTNRGALSLRA